MVSEFNYQMMISNTADYKGNKISHHDRDIHFNKQFQELKVKVSLNYFELIAFFSVVFFTIYFLLTNLISLSSILSSIGVSIGTSVIASYLFYKVRGFQLSITRRDKERIYMKISKELLEEKSSQGTPPQPSKKVSIAV